jgi:hypothetical protein
MGLRIALAWTLAIVAASGCANAPRGHVQELESGGDRVCAGKVCYRVGALPEGWRMVHQEGAAVGYFSDAVGGVISANATCRDDAEGSPLTILTQQMLIGYSERNVESQVTVPLDAREALRSRVHVKLDGVPMTLDLYVMKRDGCIFDLSYAAPPDAFTRGEHAFHAFVDGFADARAFHASVGSR